MSFNAEGQERGFRAALFWVGIVLAIIVVGILGGMWL